MYWSGVFSGLTLAAIGVMTWTGAHIGAFRSMYAEFGGPIPRVSEIALHPGFQWGAPATFLLALAVAATRKRKPAVVFGLIAALSVAAAVFEYWAVHLPIYQLSDQIR